MSNPLEKLVHRLRSSSLASSGRAGSAVDAEEERLNGSVNAANMDTTKLDDYRQSLANAESGITIKTNKANTAETPKLMLTPYATLPTSHRAQWILSHARQANWDMIREATREYECLEWDDYEPEEEIVKGLVMSWVDQMHALHEQHNSGEDSSTPKPKKPPIHDLRLVLSHYTPLVLDTTFVPDFLPMDSTKSVQDILSSVLANQGADLVGQIVRVDTSVVRGICRLLDTLCLLDSQEMDGPKIVEEINDSLACLELLTRQGYPPHTLRSVITSLARLCKHRSKYLTQCMELLTRHTEMREAIINVLGFLCFPLPSGRQGDNHNFMTSSLDSLESIVFDTTLNGTFVSFLWMMSWGEWSRVESNRQTPTATIKSPIAYISSPIQMQSPSSIQQRMPKRLRRMVSSALTIINHTMNADKEVIQGLEVLIKEQGESLDMEEWTLVLDVICKVVDKCCISSSSPSPIPSPTSEQSVKSISSFPGHGIPHVLSQSLVPLLHKHKDSSLLNRWKFYYCVLLPLSHSLDERIAVDTVTFFLRNLAFDHHPSYAVKFESCTVEVVTVIRKLVEFYLVTSFGEVKRRVVKLVTKVLSHLAVNHTQYQDETGANHQHSLLREWFQVVIVPIISSMITMDTSFLEDMIPFLLIVSEFDDAYVITSLHHLTKSKRSLPECTFISRILGHVILYRIVHSPDTSRESILRLMEWVNPEHSEARETAEDVEESGSEISYSTSPSSLYSHEPRSFDSRKAGEKHMHEHEKRHDVLSVQDKETMNAMRLEFLKVLMLFDIDPCGCLFVKVPVDANGRISRAAIEEFLLTEGVVEESNVSTTNITLKRLVGLGEPLLEIFTQIIRDTREHHLSLLVLTRLPQYLLSFSKFTSLNTLRHIICDILINDRVPATWTIKKADLYPLYYRALSTMLPLRRIFNKAACDEMVLAIAAGLTRPTVSRICLHSLEKASLETTMSMTKLLPGVLLKLSQLSRQDLAVSILEFLHGLASSSPDVLRNLVERDWKTIFGIAVQYIRTPPQMQSLGEQVGPSVSQYCLQLVYQVIAVYFTKLKYIERKRYLPFIVQQLLVGQSKNTLSMDENVELALDILRHHSASVPDDGVIANDQDLSGLFVESAKRTWIYGNEIITIQRGHFTGTMSPSTHTSTASGDVVITIRRPTGLTRIKSTWLSFLKGELEMISGPIIAAAGVIFSKVDNVVSPSISSSVEDHNEPTASESSPRSQSPSHSQKKHLVRSHSRSLSFSSVVSDLAGNNEASPRTSQDSVTTPVRNTSPTRSIRANTVVAGHSSLKTSSSQASLGSKGSLSPPMNRTRSVSTSTAMAHANFPASPLARMVNNVDDNASINSANAVNAPSPSVPSGPTRRGSDTTLHTLSLEGILSDFWKHRPCILLPEDETTQRSINVLDRTPTVHLHKIGVVYVAKGQSNETEILSNSYGSRSFRSFLEGLGSRVRLKGNTKVYTGGLDTEADTDGKYCIVNSDELAQVVFHVTTMMPFHKHDPQFVLKKRHIGNDFVTVVWNESGDDYVFDTIPSQFNLVNIVVTPLGRTEGHIGNGDLDNESPIPAKTPASLTLTPPPVRNSSFSPSSIYSSATQSVGNFGNRPDLSTMSPTSVGPTQNPDYTDGLYRVHLQRAANVPELSPISESKVLSGHALAAFIRKVAVHVNLCVQNLVHARNGGEYVSPWRERLRQIKRVRERAERAN